MSEKVEIFHFDDIANSYHGESLYCGLSSSLSLQVDKDCTIKVFGQINPRSGEYFQLQVLNEETMKTSPSRGKIDVEFRRRYIKWTCVLVCLSCILAFFNISFIPSSICSAYIICYIMLSKYGEKFISIFKF